MPRAPPGKPTLSPPLISKLKLAPEGTLMAPRAARRRGRNPRPGTQGPGRQAHTGLCCPDGSRAEAPRNHLLTPGGTFETTCPRDSPGLPRQPPLLLCTQEAHWGDEPVTALRLQPCLAGASTPTALTGRGCGFVTSAAGEGLRHRPHGGPGGT